MRGRPLKERTAAGYRDIRTRYLARFLDTPVTAITRADVAAWYHDLDPTKVTARSHAYSLFRSIMASAVDDGLQAANPVHIRGAGGKTHKPDVELFTAKEVQQLADLMPARHRLAVLLAAWCGLRFGEIAALRRSDLTLPKSVAGERTVVIPPHIVPDVRTHLAGHAQWGKDGLVFPATHKGTDYLTPASCTAPRPATTPRPASTGPAPATTAPAPSWAGPTCRSTSCGTSRPPTTPWPGPPPRSSWT